jgi:hypothetical protein
LFPLLSSPHGPNKVVLDLSYTLIRCTRVSSWYSNGTFNSDLVETFKTNAFNAFVLDQVIGPFGTCNGSLLVFLGWFTSMILDGPLPIVITLWLTQNPFNYRRKSVIQRCAHHDKEFLCFFFKKLIRFGFWFVFQLKSVFFLFGLWSKQRFWVNPVDQSWVRWYVPV